MASRTIPPMSLGISPFLDEEQRTFADTIRRLAREQLDDPELARRDAAGEFWAEGWRRCGTAGLCGLPAPEKYGGGSADRVTTAAALDALGYGCPDGGLASATCRRSAAGSGSVCTR